MKTAIIILSLAFMGMLCSCDGTKSKTNSDQSFSFDTTKLAKGDNFYQCPMHPEVLSDMPGNCPKCGMNLEKWEKK